MLWKTRTKMEPGAQPRLVVNFADRSDVDQPPPARYRDHDGTGGDVAAESIADAREPLEIRWLAGSYLRSACGGPLSPHRSASIALSPRSFGRDRTLSGPEALRPACPSS